MRIIQTFWSGGANPKEKGYGWPRAEYNLISWTISCLCLRRFYNEVELYTDKQGYELLIEKLHLPYTRVHVVYNEKLCRPINWAYAKIKTYSMQTEPFLHVDGDVYISKPFTEEILNAPLIAQNREIGTMYYQKMIDNVLRFTDISLTREMMDSINTNSIFSYNMGVFGGSDLNFIHSYCKKAISFVRDNQLDNTTLKPTCEVDCNILFEQVLFAILAQKEKMNVSCVISRPIMDEGYSFGEFCDIANFYTHRYYHILGGHKRNKIILKNMVSILYSCYQKYYNTLLSLFPKHTTLPTYIGYCKYTPGRIADGIEQYIRFLNKACIHWKERASKEYSAFEYNISTSNSPEKLDCDLILNIHPQLQLYKVSSDWTETEKKLLCKHLHCEQTFPVNQIALVPFFCGKDCIETPLLDVDAQILEKFGAKGGAKVDDVIKFMLMQYKYEDRHCQDSIEKYFLEEIYRLAKQNVLIRLY